ncbi:MAG TPA: EscU/YscU/HrcU family type III secretion system export apparatus switch protein [Candidatus Baltobacteraceae bacterium]
MNDAGEKSFDATPARVAKARREGNTARAGELGANVAFLGALATLPAVGAAMAASARAAIVAASSGRVPAAQCATILALASLPAIGAAVGGVAASLAQNGGVRVVSPAFRPNRLDPFAGCKRLLSRETCGHLLRAGVGFACVAAAVAANAQGIVAAMLGERSTSSLARLAMLAATRAAWCACAVGLGFAVLEYGAARRGWLSRLRMSFAEFKREMKEQDGDPQHRSRRRSLHRSIAAGDVRRVVDAAFLVCNPTHVAVALAYRPPEEPVPRVLVRAADEAALHVRELADAGGVPIVENVALARALYAQTRAGETIPHAHYVAVAEVVAALVRSGSISR